MQAKLERLRERFQEIRRLREETGCSLAEALEILEANGSV
jgi:DNA-binding transcriptional MerR regulator